MKVEELFERIIATVKSSDIDTLKELLNEARVNQFTTLPTMVDTDGNTIFHHLMLQGDRDLARAAINTYETGFGDSYVIRNNQGKTPYQCVQSLGDEYSDFKERAQKFLGPSWKQGYILQQFMLYLKMQQEREQAKELSEDEKQYKEIDFIPILNSLRSGHCNGLASLYLQLWLEDKETQYYDLFKDIIEWDRSNESLDLELERKFEQAIGVTRAYQMDREVLKWEFSSFQEEKSRWDDASPTDEQENLFQEAIRFRVGQVFWEKIWDPEKYQNEGRIEDEFSDDELCFYLEKLCCPENNGKGFGIHANNHVISAGYKNGKLFIYDSNYAGETTNGEFSVSKNFDVDSTDGIAAAATEIRSRLYDNFGKKGHTPFSLDISFFDKKGATPGNYLTSSERKALGFYEKSKESNFEDIDAMDFSESIRPLSDLLHIDQLSEMYNKITFKEGTINRVNQDIYGDHTPLLTLLEDGDYPEAVTCLLQNGANPKLSVDDESPIQIAKSSDLDKSLNLLIKESEKLKRGTREQILTNQVGKEVTLKYRSEVDQSPELDTLTGKALDSKENQQPNNSEKKPK